MESRKIKVLVIEDDEFIAMVYQDQLSDVTNIEFELDLFTSLAEGFEALEKSDYDVLLLDLNLPDSDYQNTIKRMADIAHRLPIIIMTSTDDELLALKTMNLGGQDYLVKSNLDRTLFIRSILYGIERHQLRRQLESEKEKSDNLLKNILPETIAEELKSQGKIKARQYEDVSVMFVDFTNFTKISADMEPNELVDELHSCFSFFDSLMEKYGLEKIKTIGDAYMCAGGIPNSKDSHCRDMVDAAFGIINFTEGRFQDKKRKGKNYWRARIGIHRGPVIAGVVGSKKFTYDIWGDTVNLASRMESHSEPGQINISTPVYEALKNNSHFSFTGRGMKEVKGKGLLEMHFAHRETS